MKSGTCSALVFFMLTSVATEVASSSSTGALRGQSSTKSKQKHDNEAGTPYLLPLHRETVPVLQNGKVVSLKTAYSGKVSIGGPTAQEFSVVFDTGSGHVVLPSLDCEDKVCLQHQRYNISKSPKAWPVNSDGEKVPDDEECDQVTIGYGTGQVTGEFVHENVCLGPAQSQQLLPAISKEKKDDSVCTTMNMVVAVEMSAQPFDSFKFDGIFGLGLESLALSSQFSFFSQFSMRSSKKSRFGFFLSAGEDGEQSEIAVGGHNADRVIGPLVWAPVAAPKLGFWNIKIRSVKIGDVEIADCKKGGCKGILDTGTSHLGVPSHAMQTVTNLLTKDVNGAADCRSVAAPSMSIDINGFTITLGPEDYMQNSPSTDLVPASTTPAAAQELPSQGLVAVQDSASGSSQSLALPDSSTTHCQPRVMPVDMKKPLGPNLFILGEPVLHRYYTVYDWHSKQVGFGLSNSRRNRLAGGESSAPAAQATATVAVEALDALEGEDEEIYLMQMSVSITLC